MKHKMNVGVGAFFSIVAIIVIAGVVCATVFVPYIIETWGAWMGYHPVIQWWKGVLIYLAFALFARTGAIYTATVAAVITGLFDICGFTGF